MRFALGIEYNGAGFCGWQQQPSRCSVHDCLADAVSRVADHALTLVAAGRTDAGVHALLQVAHFDSDARRPLSAWVRGVNTHLPAGVAVLWAQQVPEQFHARFAARSRSYRYLLLNHAVRPGVLADLVGWYHLPLDAAAMHAAAQQLLGEHDFSSFRDAECQAATPVRELQQAQVRRHGDLIEFKFRANAFLHHMVRNMVGSLVQVGAGKRPLDWLGEVLQARARRVAGLTFAASGLYLSEVEYDAHWQLPATRGRIWLDLMALTGQR